MLAISIIYGVTRLTTLLAHSAQPPEVATILPAASAAVGNSLNGGSVGFGSGYGLVANGISDYWATANPATLDFVIFVYPAQQSVTQTIAFQITSPSGATVYTHTFAPQMMGYIGTWFTVSATGDFSVAGTYAVSVSADNAVIGQIPLVFAPPSQ
jgi:hypothetical protein